MRTLITAHRDRLDEKGKKQTNQKIRMIRILCSTL